jgi:hypothetical protein
MVLCLFCVFYLALSSAFFGNFLISISFGFRLRGFGFDNNLRVTYYCNDYEFCVYVIRSRVLCVIIKLYWGISPDFGVLSSWRKLCCR